MSKFDLRDISERLNRSSDTEAVVRELLQFLQATHADWRVSLAFYETSRDALVKVYTCQGNRLIARDAALRVDQLPPRLVRKFFHPSAFFTAASRASLLSGLFHSSTFYEADPIEAPSLRMVSPLTAWESCVCMPLADHEDILGLLVIASTKKNAVQGKAIGEIIPVKSMAALALAQHLHRAARSISVVTDDGSARDAAAEFQERIRHLHAQSDALEQENRAKAERVAALTGQIEKLDQSSSQYREELARVKGTITALEAQTTAAALHLNDAYTQLGTAQSRLAGLDRTVEFLRQVCQVLSLEHDPHDFVETMVEWLCTHFDLERCSLMLLEPGEQTLAIAAQHGLDAEVVEKVRVRVGQGVAGWVAHHRKTLFVRVKEDAPDGASRGGDDYNSDSFICAPLIHNGRLLGVLNLSNKISQESFDDGDVDRAQLAAALMAIVIGSQLAIHQPQRAAA